MHVHRSVCLLAFVGPVSVVAAQEPYRRPPRALAAAVTAPPPPSVSVSPSRQHLLVVQSEAMPSIAQLARPVLKLAGVRIDPATHGRQDTDARRFGLTLVSVADGSEREVELPADVRLGRAAVWTADGARFAFTNTVDDGIELWVCDVDSAKARRVDGVRLCATLGGGFRSGGGSTVRWMPDQRHLLVKLWTGAAPPARPVVPSGPTIQRSDGEKAPVRTYQDLLQDQHDAALFEHHCTSQLALVHPDTGAIRKIGEPGLIQSAAPSPNGELLLATVLERPFSFIVTAFSFPHRIVVLGLDGEVQEVIARKPLADKVPIGGVQTGARSLEWIPSEPATLVWAEALDGGDPKAEVPHRDRIVYAAHPFAGEPTQWCRTEYRFRDLAFGENGEIALATTTDRKRRWTRTWQLRVDDKQKTPELFHERAQRDSYADIGSPVTEPNDRGFGVIVRDGGAIFLRGQGATPQGDRPFLDRFDLATGQTERLFACPDGEFASVAALLAADGSELLISRESPTEPPNWFVVASGERRAVTQFADAQAQWTKGIHKKLLTYERKDGVQLSGTLFVPPDYAEGQQLPLLVWAYPREYVSRRTAGQVRGSPYRYTRLSGTSPLMMLLAGYAVLNDAAMPVVGPRETANDSFVEQLVAGAEAAIDAAVREGVAHRDRCAIAGHSYGAFMTANLLAHSDLFRAGIARSGAYNRSLTPFGFQNERRTFWEASDVYFAMSPFMHAPKIDEPILLVHGEADNNSGTFPIQSKRLYHAIKGNGGYAKLVMLPHESHGYRSRESVLHVLAESVEWLDRHVKNAEARPVEATSDRR